VALDDAAQFRLEAQGDDLLEFVEDDDDLFAAAGVEQGRLQHLLEGGLDVPKVFFN